MPKRYFVIPDTPFAPVIVVDVNKDDADEALHPKGDEPSPEELDEAAEQHAVCQSRTKQRRHSSGEGGRAGRGSPRLRTVSSGTAGSGSSAEESDEDVDEAGNNMEKLSLLDFDIEEREEEDRQGASRVKEDRICEMRNDCPAGRNHQQSHHHM